VKMIAPAVARAQRMVATKYTSNDSGEDFSFEEGMFYLLVPSAARRLVN
jgi:hypothetical protein